MKISNVENEALVEAMFNMPKAAVKEVGNIRPSDTRTLNCIGHSIYSHSLPEGFHAITGKKV